jgi:hypothetical protein
MKLLNYFFFFITNVAWAQTDQKKLVDSLKLVADIPYICRDSIFSEMSNGCGDKIFWRTVSQKQNIIPFLIDKLSDTTKTNAIVPKFGGQYTVADVAFVALQEIIKDIPTFKLLGTKFDKNGCGYCAYWFHLRKNITNRRKFQANVLRWYNYNKSNLVWVPSSKFLTCDCAGRHPNGGHYVVRKIR